MLVGVVDRRRASTADMIPEDLRRSVVVRRDADEVAEQIKTKVLDAGIDGVIEPITTHRSVTTRARSPRVGEALKPLIDG